MKAYGGVKFWFDAYLISVLDGGELSALRNCRITFGVSASTTDCIRRPGRCAEEKNILPPPAVEPGLLANIKELYISSTGGVYVFRVLRESYTNYFLNSFNRFFFTMETLCVLVRRIDPLPGKDLETNNEAIAVAMQQIGKHVSKIIWLLLETVFSIRSL
jgi:hypothetical protein